MESETIHDVLGIHNDGYTLDETSLVWWSKMQQAKQGKSGNGLKCFQI